MPGAHRSAPPHRSWRAQSPPGQSATATKHVGRLLLSLLLLAGCGGLVWLLVALFLGPGVHFACLPVVEYDVGAVEPVAFCREDADRWRRWTTPALARPPVLLDDLQFSGSIGTLTTRLAAGPRDAQILYVVAQGVSDGGEAYLLLSDYLRGDSTRRSDSGRYKLGDLLRQVDRCPARLKLLILDVGHLAADPRSAMAVNEFPRLLEEELRRVDRPGDPPDLFANLWVLSANGPLETSHASSSARESAFGHFVAEGLQGSADRDGNGWVDLDELTEFVRTRVALWVRQETAGQETQTPRLLRGRLGRRRAAGRDRAAEGFRHGSGRGHRRRQIARNGRACPTG